jgi:hypothetical protein
MFATSSSAQIPETQFDTWQEGYEKIHQWKFLSPHKDRDYQFKVSIDGQVTLSTGKYRHYFSAGEWGCLAPMASFPHNWPAYANNFMGQL